MVLVLTLWSICSQLYRHRRRQCLFTQDLQQPDIHRALFGRLDEADSLPQQLVRPLSIGLCLGNFQTDCDDCTQGLSERPRPCRLPPRLECFVYAPGDGVCPLQSSTLDTNLIQISVQQSLPKVSGIHQTPAFQAMVILSRYRCCSDDAEVPRPQHGDFAVCFLRRLHLPRRWPGDW